MSDYRLCHKYDELVDNENKRFGPAKIAFAITMAAVIGALLLLTSAKSSASNSKSNDTYLTAKILETKPVTSGFEFALRPKTSSDDHTRSRVFYAYDSTIEADTDLELYFFDSSVGGTFDVMLCPEREESKLVSSNNSPADEHKVIIRSKPEETSKGCESGVDGCDQTASLIALSARRSCSFASYSVVKGKARSERALRVSCRPGEAYNVSVLELDRASRVLSKSTSRIQCGGGSTSPLGSRTLRKR